MHHDIDYQITGAVAKLLHARPQARNAESKRLLDELDQALTEATADERVRSIVIGGRATISLPVTILRRRNATGKTSRLNSGGSMSSAATSTTPCGFGTVPSRRSRACKGPASPAVSCGTAVRRMLLLPQVIRRPARGGATAGRARSARQAKRGGRLRRNGQRSDSRSAGPRRSLRTGSTSPAGPLR